MTSTTKHEIGYDPDYWHRTVGAGLDRFRVELTDGAMLDAIGDVTGKQVVDIGTGTGYLARMLGDLGATATGIDIDPGMIGLAIEHPRCTFMVGDACDLPLPDAAYDLATMNHSANDIEDIATAFTEAARVLRPGGRLMMMVLHPCLYERPGDDWPDAYYRTRPVMHLFDVAGQKAPRPVEAWLRPLSAYFEAFNTAGLTVADIREPRPSEAQMADAWWCRAWNRPMFALLIARKP